MKLPDSVGREVLFQVVDDHVAIITLNRPDKRNAVNVDVTRAIADLVELIEADDRIRVVILTSCSDQFFCAGADLQIVSEGRRGELVTPEGGFAGLVDVKRVTPWIAAVSGPVLAGGFELALACDMIVAADTTRFGLPEVKRGLFAAGGGAHRLARVLPRNIAIELVVTGDTIDAARAYSLGLVNYLVPVGQALDQALVLARAIAANGPLSISESVAIARLAGERSDAELRALSETISERIFASEDAMEGSRAFLEKRPAVWKGR
jgi:enoyl-CoA hydratase